MTRTVVTDVPRKESTTIETAAHYPMIMNDVVVGG